MATFKAHKINGPDFTKLYYKFTTLVPCSAVRTEWHLIGLLYVYGPCVSYGLLSNNNTWIIIIKWMVTEKKKKKETERGNWFVSLIETEGTWVGLSGELGRPNLAKPFCLFVWFYVSTTEQKTKTKSIFLNISHFLDNPTHSSSSSSLLLSPLPSSWDRYTISWFEELDVVIINYCRILGFWAIRI